MNKKPANSNPTKEFFSLLKSIEKTTKNQARISSYNPDNISSFMVEICPLKGVYQHAKFLFQIQLMLYPREFPNVICLSDIYHPNIEHGEDYHNVCLNLFDNWNRSFGLIDVIQGLIFLLYQPNLSDPISSFFNSRNTNEEVFRKNVYTSLHGGFVDGIEFLPNPGIIEYNETMKRKSVTDHRIIVVDEIVDDKCQLVQEISTIENCEDGKNGADVDTFVDSHDEETLTTVMRNNNAAQLDMIGCQEECTVHECVVEDDVDDGDGDDEEEEEDENLPTRDILSPNAFYSDLICSRYAQADGMSDIDDIFDDLGSYYYGDSEDDDDDDYEDDDINVEFIHDDDYLPLPSSDRDPAASFMTKWRNLRAVNDQSKQCPAPMTSIILTSVLNPFRDLVAVFYVCDMHNCDNNWRYPGQSVYRVQHNDGQLHLLAWLQNVCRWALGRPRMASWSMAGCGCDQLCWYSLLCGLSYGVSARLRHRHNYGSWHFDCHYV